MPSGYSAAGCHDGRVTLAGRTLLFYLLNEGAWVVRVTPTLVLFEQDGWWPGVRGVVPVIAGAVLFAAGSALTLDAGSRLIADGDGTPMPFRPTQQLVVTGPYARVRNPQAIGGIVLMVGVALALDSSALLLLPLIYAAYLLVVQLPAERVATLERLGDAYAAYREAVPGWWPGRGR